MAKKQTAKPMSAEPLKAESTTPTATAAPTPKKSTDLYSKVWRKSYDKELERNKPVIFQLNSNRKDAKGEIIYQAEVFFTAEERIFCKKTNKRRIIRYNKAEPSIYADEQHKATKPSIIRFNRGMCVALYTDPALVEYMRLSNLNSDNKDRIGDNPAKFSEISAKKQATISIKDEVTSLEAMQLALRAPLEKVIPIAKYLNIDTNKSIDEIRYSLKALATKNPRSFIDLFDNKEAIFKGTCKTAVEYGILKVSTTDITWETGAKIMSIPLGQNPFDALVAYLKDKNRFAEFHSDLENRLNAIIGN